MDDFRFIIDVLADLESYAEKNDLSGMMKAIHEAREVAKNEIGQTTSPAGGEGHFIPPA